VYWHALRHLVQGASVSETTNELLRLSAVCLKVYLGFVFDGRGMRACMVRLLFVCSALLPFCSSVLGSYLLAYHAFGIAHLQKLGFFGDR
jgi:hypothetical protein